MDHTYPERAELDAIIGERKQAAKRFDDAKQEFAADYTRRKDEVSRRRAQLSKEISAKRAQHAAAMQAVGVAIAEGQDIEELTEQADNIAAAIFKLEQRETALSTLTVKPNDELFTAAIEAYKAFVAANTETRMKHSAFEKRAEEAAKHFTQLAKDASTQIMYSHDPYEYEIVKLYESVRGKLDCPDYLKARTICTM